MGNNFNIAKISIFILSFVQIKIAANEVCPEYCSCIIKNLLRHAECVAKNLINIDLNLPRRVQSLDLSNNSISILDDKCFQKIGLLNLVDIIMMYNSVMYIGRDAFIGLEDLRYINLKGNHLHKINAEIFHSNLNLTNLILSDNPLQYLRNEPLLDAPNLESLDISGCRFGNFIKINFEKFKRIKHLNISGNHLIHLDIETIDVLIKNNLDDIDISLNPIECDNEFKIICKMLYEKSVHLIGPPCTPDLTNIPTNQFMTEKIMENLDYTTNYVDVVTEKEKTSNEYDYDNEIDLINISKNVDNYKLSKIFLKNNYETNINISNGYNFYNYNGQVKIPQFWVLTIGFQIGVVTTLSIVFVLWWICTRKNVNDTIHNTENGIEQHGLI